MKYLLGEFEHKGDKCDFKDVWLLPGTRTHELDGEAAEKGFTFNNLNAKLEKRIDFVLVRGDVDINSFELMEVIGAKSKSPVCFHKVFIYFYNVVTTFTKTG